MSARWSLPRPIFAADDNDLFLVNVLLASMVKTIKRHLGEDGTAEEAHQLLVACIADGIKELHIRPVAMSEDGIEDLLTFVRKELGKHESH